MLYLAVLNNGDVVAGLLSEDSDEAVIASIEYGKKNALSAH